MPAKVDSLDVHINRASINHKQQFVCGELDIPADTDVKVRADDLHHLHAWNTAEDGRQVERAGLPDVFIGNNVDIRGSF